MNSPNIGSHEARPVPSRQHQDQQQAAQQPQARIIPGYLSPATPPPAVAVNPYPSPPRHMQQQVQQPYAVQFRAPAGPFTGPVPPLGTRERLALPLPDATLAQAVGRFFRKYGTFSGRASRGEFWWVQLFMVLAVIAGTILGAISEAMFGSLFALFMVASVVPYLALSVRRLHDANLNGPLLALGLIPAVGPFVALILTLMPSKSEGARFDKVPAQYLPQPCGQVRN